MSDNSPIPTSQEVFNEAFTAAGGTLEGSESSEESVPTEVEDISSQPEVEPTDNLEADAPEDQEQELSTDPENSDKELSDTLVEVAVKGKDGKRKNIKVDLSDKDKMIKYVQKAANAVKLQSERDALQAQVSKLEEAQSVIDNLQSIVDLEGFEGLIDKLNADNGGFEAWMQTKLERHELKQHATDDELKYLEELEQREKLQRRLELIEQQQQERENKVLQEREKAEMDRLASEVNPIYFKYTFDGKLGDSVAEQRQNRAMFREVTSTLDQLAEQGVKITPQIIEKEFRAYAAPLLKGVNRRVRQNTKSTIDKKKAEATTHAQQQVRKGYSNQDSIDKAMDSRNWTQSLADLWVKGKL